MTEQLELAELSDSRTQVTKAIIALFIALTFVAFIPVLFRFSENTVSPNATVFNRFWIAAIIIGFWNGLLLVWKQSRSNMEPSLSYHSPKKLFPKTYTLILLIIMAIFFVASQLLWAWSITRTTVANSEVLHSITPIFTTLIAWSLFGQKFDRVFLLGIGISLIGSIILTANDFSLTVDKLEGDKLALLSACFWGIYLVVVEKLQTQLDILAIVTWKCFLGTIFLLPITLVIDERIFPSSGDEWLIAILLAIALIFANILITYSFRYLSSGLVATILLLNPIMTAILGWLFFSETLNWLNLLSFFVILFGIYLTTLSKYAIKT